MDMYDNALTAYSEDKMKNLGKIASIAPWTLLDLERKWKNYSIFTRNEDIHCHHIIRQTYSGRRDKTVKGRINCEWHPN